LVAEIGGFLVVLRRGGDLGERTSAVLFRAGAEQAPKAAAQTAGLSARGLRHSSTVRDPPTAASVRVSARHAVPRRATAPARGPTSQIKPDSIGGDMRRSGRSARSRWRAGRWRRRALAPAGARQARTPVRHGRPTRAPPRRNECPGATPPP